MKKYNNIKPTGLKGQQHIDRIKELMGKNINEDTKNSVVELTKIGPDGIVYGIVRENHEYYIKTSEKNSNLVVEDFNYIGGLQNKKKEAHGSYAKAIKRLNLKFLSLNESFGGSRVNVFENDLLLKEDMPISAGGFGFVEEEVVEEMEDMNGTKSPEDKKTSGDNLDGDFDKKPSASSTNTGDHKEGEKGHDKHIMEDDELTESEKAVDNMIEGLDAVGSEDGDVDNDGDEDDSDDYLVNKRMKIGKAMDMDESEEKLAKLIENMSTSEAKALIEALKKKV